MSASETSSIEDRLAALEAERGVGAALARYGHSIDYGLAEQWADCFTADGVFDIWVRALDGTWAPWARHEGRAQLTAFAATHAHAPEHALKHLMVEPAITIDGARASAHSYFVRIDGLPSGPSIRAFGRYVDELERGADGRWRLRVRKAEIESMAAGSQPHLVSEEPT